MPEDSPALKPATVVVKAGRPERTADAPLNEPITMASTYVAGGDVEYGRYGNPTWAAFEEALGALEGGRCLSFSSGLATVATVLDLVGNDSVVVAPRHAYNGTVMQLADLESRGRLRARLVDITDTDAVVAACEDAALVWLESPTNPALEVADIPAIRAAAHDAGAYVVVDNTFATPLLQQPLALGADLVIHAATKFIGGHSDLLTGVAITADDSQYELLRTARTHYGATPGALECFLALRGLRTLPVRLKTAVASAQVLRERLEAHPAVHRVRYPGFGAVVSFELADAETVDRACRATQVIWHATSLGGVETTMERRSVHPGQEHIPPGLIRMSVGCEDVEDLWADLEVALSA
jgi:cystathionine gamma-synthase